MSNIENIKNIYDKMSVAQFLGCVIKNPNLYAEKKLDNIDLVAISKNIYNSIAKLIEGGAKELNESMIMEYIEKETPSLFEKSPKQTISLYLTRCINDANVDNVDTYFKRIKKHTLLRHLAAKGLDISYYYCDDDNPDEKMNANNHLDHDTAEEIRDHYVNELNNIPCYTEGFNPYIGYKPEELPDAKKEMTWLVDNYYINGGKIMISGPSKSGKSQYAYLLATALQNGVDFLDMHTKKSNVLYLDFELPHNEIYYRCENAKQYYKNFYGIDLKESIKIFPLNECDYNVDKICEKVNIFLKNNPQYDVVVYDNFQSLIDGNMDSNKNSEVRSILKKLRTACKGATMIYICHTTKQDNKSNGSKDPLNAAEGSNAFGAFADEATTIKTDSDSCSKIYYTMGRHISKNITIPCEYSAETFYMPYPPKNQDDKNKILGITPHKTKDDLKKEYPELSELIGDEGATLNKIKKEFPDETEKSMKEKGFFYSGKKLEKCREGIKTKNFYLENPFITK